MIETAAALAALVKLIVDRPDSVHIEATSTVDGILMGCEVHPADMGKVIGRGGRTARSLRTLLLAVSQTQGQRFYLEIRSEGPGEGLDDIEPR